MGLPKAFQPAAASRVDCRGRKLGSLPLSQPAEGSEKGGGEALPALTVFFPWLRLAASRGTCFPLITERISSRLITGTAVMTVGKAGPSGSQQQGYGRYVL